MRRRSQPLARPTRAGSLIVGLAGQRGPGHRRPMAERLEPRRESRMAVAEPRQVAEREPAQRAGQRDLADVDRTVERDLGLDEVVARDQLVSVAIAELGPAER